MRTQRFIFTSILIISLASNGASAAECGLSRFTNHIDKNKTSIYTSNAGHASLYFRSNMDVNTDGSPKSYHPDDPYAKSIAFNNIVNAMTDARNANGRSLMCEPKKGDCFVRLVSAFEAARDAKFAPSAIASVKTKYIIPWKKQNGDAWPTPCTIKSGPFSGYFVSQTSLIVDQSKAECDQARYLDSFAFNAVVLPKHIQWQSQGTVTDDGDLVVVRDAATGKVSFAINGDRGPPGSIGEGTMALVAEINGKKLSGTETYQELKKLAVADVQYLIFPKDDIRRVVGKTYTQTDIDRAGAGVFAKWGGVERLNACANLPR